MVVTTAGAMAAPAGADRDGLTRDQEVRIAETNPNDGDEDKDLDEIDDEDDD